MSAPTFRPDLEVLARTAQLDTARWEELRVTGPSDLLEVIAYALQLEAEMKAMQPVLNRHASELAMEKLEADRRRIRAEAHAEAEAGRA